MKVYSNYPLLLVHIKRRVQEHGGCITTFGLVFFAFIVFLWNIIYICNRTNRYFMRNPTLCCFVSRIFNTRKPLKRIFRIKRLCWALMNPKIIIGLTVFRGCLQDVDWALIYIYNKCLPRCHTYPCKYVIFKHAKMLDIMSTSWESTLRWIPETSLITGQHWFG